MTDLERDRRRAELTPVFEFEFEAIRGQDPGRTLLVTLAGPVSLDALDEVTITIVDETGALPWARGLPDGVSPEEAAAFVWGPWEFNTGASEQVVSNRQTRPCRYSRADGRNWDRLGLVRTGPGLWMTGTSAENWKQERHGPLRLSVTARRGDLQWQQLYEIDVPEPQRAVVL